ncbi:MAG TPA: Ig-like domain-containing protein [Polyangiaceae bacterium]|jgi:hypothetical protein
MAVKLGPAWALLLALVVAIVAACGSTGGDDNNGNPDGGSDGTVTFGDGAAFGDGQAGPLTISPPDAVVTVNYGQPATFPYVAYEGNNPVSATWDIDRGELGTIDNSGTLTTTSTLGGKATITATAGDGSKGSTTVTIVVNYTQNGDPNAGDAGGGAGGTGGVGGEGPGAAVSNTTLGVLNGTPTTDPGLGWLYPYDATVWPRGLLAPLLQWTLGAQGDYDAVYIHAKENAFEYKGYFAKTKAPFSHHPIPQAAWDAMTYSNAGEDLEVDLVFAKGSAAFGPITEKWKIGNGPLKGTVYYNSYGTALAQNLCCAANGSPFGGATLAIKGGSTSPVLVAGSNGGSAQCRVCHSVSADGSTLLTQHGDDYAATSQYDLKNGYAETPMSPQDSRFAFPALAPDGSFLFTSACPLPGVNNTAASALFSVPSGNAMAANGLPSGLRACTPVFSPDGKHVAYMAYAGTGADGKSLAVMDYASGTFGAQTVLDTPSGTLPDVFPSFLPTSDAVVFERETSTDGELGATRYGSHAELWWSPTASAQPVRLDKLNGLGYLPNFGTNHAGDATLNYEPTVNPVPSGGYAWVVFTSRRAYGNVATIDPFWSDPREHDISATPTTKKLWVAAIDLNAKPGTDPSHPAFYLPAQELLAGNSRGYWVVDPCKVDGTSCLTGDECCGGYCRSGDGGLVCQPAAPGCSHEFEKCTSSADCCGGQNLTCIDGRCAQQTPN